MNRPKKPNLKLNKSSSKKLHQKTIQKKSSIDSLNNICLIPNKELYQTIIIKKNSSKYNSKLKHSENKASCCIKNRKTIKSASKFKYQKNKNYKDALNDLLSLSSSGESLSNNKNKKSKDICNSTHNTINAVNHRLRIFQCKNNNFGKNDNKTKYRSIETTRTNFRHIRCNTYFKNNNKGEISSNKKNRINLKDIDSSNKNKNIIINFFNAPISKYNREYYINNFHSNNYNNMNIISNLNNNISKDKQIKKNIKILNHINNINNVNSSNNNFINNNIFNKDCKNIFPLFSYINTGNNNININNVNNYNEVEYPVNQNKTRKRCNTLENLIPLSNNNNNNNMHNNQSKLNSGSLSKKNSVNKDSKEKINHNYNKIKDNNKYIKNKKIQSLIGIKNIEGILKVGEKNNRLKNVAKNNKKNSTNLNTINKSINKNNIINIKHDFTHSNTINNENIQKNKHNIFNILSKGIFNVDSKNMNINKNNKIRTNQKFLSFNKFLKNDSKDLKKLNAVKSIEVESRMNRIPKFSQDIFKKFPFTLKNKNKFFSIIDNKVNANNNNKAYISKKSQPKKNKNFNTIINNNCMDTLNNRIYHFNISNSKNNKKKINYNSGKTIDSQKRKKVNNNAAVKIKTAQVSTEKNIKIIKNDEKLKALIKNNEKDNEKEIEKEIENKSKNISTNKNNSIICDNLQNIVLIKNNNLISKNINKEEILNKDPQYVEEYLEEILCNLFLEEKVYLEKIGFQMSSDFLSNYGINPETRTCLIDSIIDLQKIFKFNERTLFITIQLFDRYITTSIINDLAKIEEEDLDIIITTCLLIASKIEESILYKLTDYLGILSDKYTTDNIIEMEDKILGVINYNVVIPTMLDFFEVFAEKCQLNNIEINKGLFLLNIILLDINLSQISGSVIAYSIVHIVTGKDCSFLLKKINKYFKKGYDKDNLDSFFLLNNEKKIDELCELIKIFSDGILKTEYNHVYKKFNSKKFDYVSRLIGDLTNTMETSNNSFN